MSRPSGPCVLVTGTGGGGLGEQLVKALRLAGTPYRIVAADITPLSTGLARGDEHAILPPAGADDYLDAVLAACRRYGAEVVLPGSEAELKVLSARRAEVAAAGLFLPINARPVIERCMDKLALSRALEELGVKGPRYVRVTSPDDVRDLPVFPMVFKPSTGTGGSADTFIVQTPEEARTIAEYLCAIRPEFIAQEYVGRFDQEYTVGVLSDMDGNFLNSIALRRHTWTSLGCRMRVPNRTGRAELGETLVISSGISQGDIGPFPEVCGPCEKIAAALGSQGPCNIQLRLVDGEIHLFEINPRFSGTTSLRALAGFNEPDVLIRKHVLGEAIEPRFPYASGVIMRRLEESLVAPGQTQPKE